MKARIAALLLLALAACGDAAAQTPPVVKNKDGEILAHPKVVGFDGQFFSVQHDGGIAKVAFDAMPVELRGNVTPSNPALQPAVLATQPRIQAAPMVLSPRQIPNREEAKYGRVIVARGLLHLARGSIEQAKANPEFARQNPGFAFYYDDGEEIAVYWPHQVPRTDELLTLVTDQRKSGADVTLLIYLHRGMSDQILDWCKPIDYEAFAPKWKSRIALKTDIQRACAQQVKRVLKTRHASQEMKQG